MSLSHTRISLLMPLVASAVPYLTACATSQDILDPPAGVVIDSTVISSEGVTPAEGRTYEYDFSSVRPDSVLTALWEAGLDIEVAWLPLHYLCEDARGPRLTVQLAAPDDAMASHDFSPGTGRLLCSSDLTRYEISGT